MSSDPAWFRADLETKLIKQAKTAVRLGGSVGGVLARNMRASGFELCKRSCFSSILFHCVVLASLNLCVFVVFTTERFLLSHALLFELVFFRPV